MAGNLVSGPPTGETTDMVSQTQRPVRSIQFWGTFAALCLLAFISALDVAIITTSLPTITNDIGGATQYVWIASSFVMASAVLQPLFGQLADLFGRRDPFVVATALFTLGSGVAGGAINPGMLIAGRTLQGVGAGGVYLLLSIVCCDMVPLRERGKFLGLMNAWAGVAAALGPVVGGAIAQRDWRWIFYLNLPICGVALGMLFLFMHMRHGDHSASGRWRVSRLDWLGSLIFTPSMIGLLFGLIMGGVQYPWSSWRIILPLVLGCLGWAAFHLQQHYAASPSIPTRLFYNRTSATGYVLTFLSSILIQLQSYFLPVYFQAALGATVLDSGINFLPFAMGTLAFAAISGLLLSRLGAFRPLHATAFALSALGFGLFTLLDSETPKVAWIFYQLIASAGSGLTLSTLLPAIMAGLPEADVASASAAFTFMRTFGYVWGVTIPSVIFNAVVDNNLYMISSDILQSQLRGGGAYAFASQMYFVRDMLPPELRGEVILLYIRSLRAIWWVGLGLSIISFFAVGLERGLELRTTLETAYGLDEEAKTGRDTTLETGNSEGASAETKSMNVPQK